MVPPKSAKRDATTSFVDVEIVALDDLRPFDRNARTHSPEQVDQIVASINEFGWTTPVLAETSTTGIVVAGHGRRLAALKIYAGGGRIRLPNGGTLPPGMVPAIDCSGWSEAQRRAYTIADNKIAENAGWDESLLKIEIGDLFGGDHDFPSDALGFSQDQIEAFLAKPATSGAPDEFPEFDEQVETDHCCPKCGYKWSGKSS